MEGCLFCKIINKEIPSEMVYENDETMVFLDINPVNPGHLLVVPKEHYKDMLSTPSSILKEIMDVAQKVAPAAMKAVGSTAFNVGVNNGADAGQIVDHMHLHIMPRYSNDGHKLWKGTPYGDGEAIEVAIKVREALN